MFLWSIQIMWLVDIFRAKVVDTSDHTLTIEVSPILPLYMQFISNGSNNFNSLGNWRPWKDGCTYSELREVWDKRSR